MRNYSVAALFANTIKETLLDGVVFLLGQFGPLPDECGKSLFVSVVGLEYGR